MLEDEVLVIVELSIVAVAPFDMFMAFSSVPVDSIVSPEMEVSDVMEFTES